MKRNRATNSPEGSQAYWKITLFGGMKITRNGEPIAPPPYRTFGFLAYLLLRDKLPIRRERLGGLLYGDLPGSKIRGRISDYIWQIKKHLPGFPLITTTDTISLDRQPIWVDVKEFQKETNTPGDPLGESFIELYQGELLPELYDGWLLVERERWRSHYQKLLRALVNNLLADEKFDRAILHMERLLRDEPYDEEVIRLLMQTYKRIGRRGAALAAYEKFHLLSMEQIGLEPDAKTKQIYESIKSQPTPPHRGLLDENPLPINPDEILRQAQSALEQGDRDGLKRLRDALPKDLSYDQTLWMHLLEFDENLVWSELDRAETILHQYEISSPSLRLRWAKLALAKHEYPKAKALVETLLDDAHRLRHPQLEAEALIVLSMAKTELGEIQDSLPVLDRAISLSRKVDTPAVLVQAYNQKGKYWRLKGGEESSKDILEQAVKIARQYNLRPLLIETLNELGTSSNYYGRYQDSLKYLFESLELVRDLGISSMEASILLRLSGTFDFLGRHAETAEAIKNASKIYEEQQDALGLAKCHYNLAYSLMNMKAENVSDAIEYAEKALSFFSGVGNRGWQASTHTAVGYFRWLAGQSDQAIKDLDAAIKIHTELDELLFIPENYAYKGLAYLQKGDPQKGLEFTQVAVRELTRRNLSDVAAEIYYAHACVLQALKKKKEAKLYIELGYETYLDSARDIVDDHARAAYFERDPLTRRLMQMVYDLGLAPRPKKTVIIHELPGSAHYKVNLELTVDAGAADQALGVAQGTSAMRRARLKRILKEGNTHGNRLTVKEIADLFNVSPRTIHRDLKIVEGA